MHKNKPWSKNSVTPVSYSSGCS